METKIRSVICAQSTHCVQGAKTVGRLLASQGAESQPMNTPHWKEEEERSLSEFPQEVGGMKCVNENKGEEEFAPLPAFQGLQNEEAPESWFVHFGGRLACRP